MHDAESRPARLDESPAPAYALPDPLVSNDGRRIEDLKKWKATRRGELLEHFVREEYGHTPIGRPAGQFFEITSLDHEALGGRATRKEVAIWFEPERRGPVLRLLIYLPNGRGEGTRPAFLGLNFYGNHTVSDDAGIALAMEWRPATPGVTNRGASEAARGRDAGKWPIEAVLARGYAVATAYCGDLCPDRSDGLSAGVNAWLGGAGTEERSGDAWGAIGIWAWGLSRALDYLETDRDIDAKRVAVHGHSRLGKAALWAAAQDERFALVISNESGCGGAALHKRIHGETVAKINAQFPHWFAKNFRRYDDDEAALPVDQHELLALIAPRPLYVASAEGDDWADPRGEFLAVKGAEPVYRLFGAGGPAAKDVPPVHQPVGERLRYHIRAGGHDLTVYDWARYLDFADECFGPERR